ncbi:MAG: TolC family protein [Myxococcota bacterium]|jgi:outer membrane protein TolC|nr:TolC family protein [Myxococcota bacterium]
MLRWLPLMFVLVGPARVAVASDDAQDPGEDLVRQALDSNPTMESLRERVAALQSRTIQASARPEPMVGIEYSNVPVTTPVPGNHPMSGLQLKLQRTLLFPGTVPRRVASAEARVQIGEASYGEGRVALAAAVRRGFWRLTLTRQLRAVTEDHLAQVDQLIDAVRAGYEVGKAGQHDLLNLQLLRDRLDDDLQEYDRVDRELTAGLTAAIHAEGTSPVQTPSQTPMPPHPGSLDALLETATTHNPTLARLSATEAAETAAAEMARREAWPDVTLWAGYRVRAPIDGGDDGTNQASLGLSIPLPTAASKRWGGAEAEHEALARAAQSSSAAFVDDLRAALDAALARWERATDKAVTYREQLIPDARTTLEATLVAYQVGRADYASLFQAEVQLLDLERAARTAETDAALAEVDVAMTLGTAERTVEGVER